MKINLSIQIKKKWIVGVKKALSHFTPEGWVLISALSLAGISTVYFFIRGDLIAYADAESHLNIAKRIVDGLTTGVSHLGGVWLPLPHLLLAPFVKSDILWHTGLAGSIVSGIFFVISALFIYKLAYLITQKPVPSFIASLIFITNPNILYLQSTAMTELTLTGFLILSSYFFVKFLYDHDDVSALTASAFFGFCASLSRYDGWSLVLMEAGILFILLFRYTPNLSVFKTIWNATEWRAKISLFHKRVALGTGALEGRIILFSSLAFFGILMWIMWDYLILGNPLYFMDSPFSARAQQLLWMSKGELPAYHNIFVSLLYYTVTAMSNAGVVIFLLALSGLYIYLSDRKEKNRGYIALLLAVPFFFHVANLFLGQSVIFIPHLTPPSWDSILFNVRYGALMVPFFGILVGILFERVKISGKLLILGLMSFQILLYLVGYSPVISYADGVGGLSSQALKTPDAQYYLEEKYEGGLVLIDDYARTISIVRTHIPMQNIIYVGNKKYWEESLVTPEKYASLIVMQQGDDVWKNIYEKPEVKTRLLQYFDPVYTSKNVLIFKRKTDGITKTSLGMAFPNFTSAEKIWPFQCIDTMKYSRDKAQEWKNRSDLQNLIDYDIKMVKESGADCIAIDTAYDKEFVPYLTKWVNSARRAGLMVWFRGNMSAWEGWFKYPKYKDITQHHRDIYEFVLDNPTLFKDGDIFTPVHEPENGLPNIWATEARKKAYLKFISDSYDNCVVSFKEIGKNVSCGYFSTSGEIGLQVMTRELAQKLGHVVIDYYVKDPAQMEIDIQAIHERLGVPVVLGEFGAPIPDKNGTFTKDEQAEFVKELLDVFYRLRDMIGGVNYWVLSDSSTSLLDTKGDPKPVYSVLQHYYSPALLLGTVIDKKGKPIKNAVVTLMSDSSHATTTMDGVFSLSLLPYMEEETTTLSITAKDFETATVTRYSNDGNIAPLEITLTKTPTRLSKFFSDWWNGFKSDLWGEPLTE